MNTFTRSFVISTGVLLGLAIAFVGGLLTYNYLPWRATSLSELLLLREAHAVLVQHGYYEPPANPDLEYGMIRGMLAAYDDPYTTFLEPVQTELEAGSLQGSYGGIGASFGNDAEGFFVLYPFPDSPASKAGILEGDRLLQVDELQVTPELSIDRLVAAVRGPVGKRVTLRVATPPEYAAREVRVQRAEIPLPSVTWHIEAAEPRLGVIEINLIAASTPKEIQEAVRDLTARGATHFVLDLRNNGGGLLTSGIDTARLFLNEGVILNQQYKDKDVENYQVEKPGPLVEIPLVVLVNNNTASAAEIIAGALKANQRAQLVGRATYGKNTIQLVFTLSDGSSMHVTAARWWFPDLDFPNGDHGLEPDVELSEETLSDPGNTMQAVIEIFFGES